MIFGLHYHLHLPRRALRFHESFHRAVAADFLGCFRQTVAGVAVGTYCRGCICRPSDEGPADEARCADEDCGDGGAGLSDNRDETEGAPGRIGEAAGACAGGPVNDEACDCD